MNCVVPGRGIRAFGKAVQCLAKIGEDLHIEALKEGLSLRTVNSARSAFASFLFTRRFFNSYSDGLRGSGEDEEDGTVKCKITIRSVLSVFRAVTNLEKTVDRFSLSVNLKLNKLVFIFHCRHGIVKTHQLGFQECDSLRAVFTKDLCPNHIKVQSRTLGEVVGNFPSFLEEVTMSADPESVQLRNYCEEDSVDQRSTMTEVRLMPSEFDDYHIGVDTAITFCLKELRAILLFTDALPHTLSVHFESAGKPVVFSIDEETDFTADFVLATLMHFDHGTSANNGPSSTSNTHTATSTTATARRKHPIHQHTHQHKEVTRHNGSRARRKGNVNGQGFTRREGENEKSVEDEWTNPFFQARGDPTRVGGRDGEMEGSEGMDMQRSGERESRLQPSSTRESGEIDAGADSFRQVSHVSGACGDDVMMGEGEGVDPIDALFGEENMMDVAGEEWGGWEEGDWGDQGRCASEKQSNSASQREPQQPQLSDVGVSRSPHLTSPPHPHTSGTNLTPPPVSHVSDRLLPAVEEVWGEEGEATTQDSILHDSGFLPGTPPAKKFKASFSHLRKGLLHSDLPTPREPAILAPDSEDSDSD